MFWWLSDIENGKNWAKMGYLHGKKWLKMGKNVHLQRKYACFGQQWALFCAKMVQNESKFPTTAYLRSEYASFMYVQDQVIMGKHDIWAVEV